MGTRASNCFICRQEAPQDLNDGQPKRFMDSWRARQCFGGQDATECQRVRFVDSWWRSYDTPTDGFIDSRGKLNRLPLRLESTEFIVYGLVDAKKMWAEFEALDEPFVPVLVGGKAVVTIWFNNFIDTDCGGAYLETWYNTFVTPKGQAQLELPYETPFSAIIQDPRSLSYLQRVVCSEHPTTSTGAGAVAIEGGRSIWGFPKHPELGKITFDYDDYRNRVAVDTTHLGKKAVSLRADVPQDGAEGTVTIPLEIETGPSALIGGPRLGGTHNGHNGAHQSRYGVAFKCTQHVKLWNKETDCLEFGDDAHYAMPIKGWNFEPVLKVHSPDFKIIAHKPSDWISGIEAAGRTKPSNPSLRFSDDWWRKFDMPTDGFLAPSGVLNRLPLRLESTEVIVYGLVDANKMWAEFEALEEAFVPVLVGGKAVVTLWFNNFTDTDCGGAYLETWYNTFVTPKTEPQLELPYDTPFSAIIQDPRSLSYLQRVICSEAPTSTGAGAAAIEGGRSIWGFPKHPELGQIAFEYTDCNGIQKVEFNATHSGKKVVSLNVSVPQDGAEGTVTIPLELETGPDSLISGPRLGGIHKDHNGSHQTRYGVAFKCTQHVRLWDAETDSLEFGDDAHYATPIKGWDFEPVLKVHSPDFKIIAHKPSNWISGSEAEKRMASR